VYAKMMTKTTTVEANDISLHLGAGQSLHVIAIPDLIANIYRLGNMPGAPV
jgi:hypothetical protein